jgi:hypothetical protein
VALVVEYSVANPDLSWGLLVAAGRRGGRFLSLDFMSGV